MQFIMSKIKCPNCRIPESPRLGLFQPSDEYECYAESYVKCFWGLCEHHKSIESFTSKHDNKVITTQPTARVR